MSGKRTYLILLSILLASSTWAQCLSDYTWSFSPEPIDGHWNSNEEVTVCLIIDSEDWQGGSHYIHSLIPAFGSGWDLSTLTPIAPGTCSGDGGFWAWYQGPILSAASGNTFGPGFFYESPDGGTDNLDPGDNYGDHCPSLESLEFCFIIRTVDTGDCLTTMNLDITVNTYSDDQSGGSFLSTICGNNEQATFSADITCCDADAGINQVLSLCNDDAPILLDDLVNHDGTGTWHFNDPSSISLGNSFLFDPLSNPAGTYIYVIDGVLFDCQDLAFIEINVQNGYDAGDGGTFYLCNSGGIINLNDLLSDEDPGGFWTDNLGNPTDPYFSPSADPGGTYTYSFPASGSCPASFSQLNLVLSSSLNPGLGSPTTICPCQGNTALLSLLSGNPQTWGYWTGPLGNTLTDPTFYPGSSPSGTYTYHLDALNCQAQSTVQISNGVLGNPGTNNAVTLCSSSTPITPLISFLNGSPQPGGTWTGPTGSVIASGNINPASANPGPYTYTFSCGPCTAQAVVQVNLTSTPTMSLSGSVIQCNTNPVNLILNTTGTGPFNLSIMDELGATFNLSSQTNGSLVPVNSSTSHTYTISTASSAGLPYCGVNIGAGASVTIGPPPSVSMSGEHLLCPGQSLDLYPDLVGNGPYQLQIFNSVTGLTSSVGPIQAGEYFTVYPTSSGFYSVTSVTDASSPSCTASGTGQVNTTFTQAPSASLVGGGTLCNGQAGTAVVDINGQWSSYDLTIETGTGPFVIEDVSDGETISFPVPFSTPDDLPYCLSDVSPSGGSGCQSNLSDTCMSFIVLQPLITYSLNLNCNDLTQEATVSFFIQGGAGNFTVNGVPLTGNYFESEPIPNGSSFNFTVSDGMSCGPVIREGIIDCDCSGSAAGTLQYDSDTLNVCFGQALVPSYSPQGSFLDGNDALNIVIHDGSSAILGNVLQWIPADGSSFVFQSPLIYDQVYFMSAIVGNDTGNGMVDPSDVCLSSSLSVPIRFIQAVTAVMSGVTAICEGEEATISVQLGGSGPWSFEILLDGEPYDIVSTSLSNYSFNTLSPGQYSIIALTGNECTGTSDDLVSITEQALPTATIGMGGTFCQGSTVGPVVTLTGSGPWNLEYSIDGSPYSVLLGSSMDVIPVTDSGTYSLIHVSDSNCENDASGSALITALPAPVVSFSDNGPVCEGESVLVDVQLAGLGPWNLGLNINGIAQDTLTYTGGFQLEFESTTQLFANYLTDSQCPSLDLPLVDLLVNPIPEVEWSLSEANICEGSSAILTIEPSYASSFSFDLDLGNGAQSELLESTSSYELTPISSVLLGLSSLTDLNTGCQNTEAYELALQVFEIPELQLQEMMEICSDDTVSFSTFDQGFDYVWTPMENIVSQDGASAMFSWANGNATSITEYAVLSANNEGCLSRDSVLVEVISRPQVAFTVNPSVITTVNPVGNFFNQSDGENDYRWTVDGEFIQNGPWMTHFFPQDIADFYEVCLIVETKEAGCKASLCKDISVIGELTLFIPNAFSPDGDGLNDEFYPIILDADISFYHLMIFDRGGELVFETKDPNARWNGDNFHAGRPSRPGTYPYKIITRDRFGLTAREYKGFVNLLR